MEVKTLRSYRRALREEKVGRANRASMAEATSGQ